MPTEKEYPPIVVELGEVVVLGTVTVMIVVGVVEVVWVPGPTGEGFLGVIVVEDPVDRSVIEVELLVIVAAGKVLEGPVDKSVAEVKLAEETPVPLMVGKDRRDVNKGPNMVSAEDHGMNGEDEGTCQ